jgi:hypothetical protein
MDEGWGAGNEMNTDSWKSNEITGKIKCIKRAVTMVVMKERQNPIGEQLINSKEECFPPLKMRYCASHKFSLLSQIHSTPLHRIFLQRLQAQGHKAHHENITERYDLQ